MYSLNGILKYHEVNLKIGMWDSERALLHNGPHVKFEIACK
jgi:hypothetical protein